MAFPAPLNRFLKTFSAMVFVLENLYNQLFDLSWILKWLSYFFGCLYSLNFQLNGFGLVFTYYKMVLTNIVLCIVVTLF